MIPKIIYGLHTYGRDRMKLSLCFTEHHTKKACQVSGAPRIVWPLDGDEYVGAAIDMRMRLVLREWSRYS
jgi:hypothetical protein